MKPVVFLFLIFSMMACGDEDDTTNLSKSEALITGPDYTFCECCVEAAYFIEIDGDQHRFLLEELPEEFTNFLISTDGNFPLPVRIHWKPRPNPCQPNEILIKKISIIQATPF